MAVYENENIYILTEGGSVYTFGDDKGGNRYGQFGNGGTLATKAGVKVEGLPPISQI